MPAAGWPGSWSAGASSPRLFAWVQNAEQLYILRFALGVAEAGFFPGAILFLSLWVPTKHRSKILALFYLAQPLTTVLGAPLAGWLLGHDGAFGLEGWRFMYLMVAIPAIIVGVIAWFYLPNRPKDAKWLNPDEQEWLTGALEKEAKTKTSGEHKGLRTALHQRPGLDAGLHLLRLHLRPVRPGVLPAHHHQRLRGPIRHQVRLLREGPDHRDPVPAGRDLPLCSGPRTQNAAA